MKYSAQVVLINEEGLVLGVSRKDDHNSMGLPGGKMEDEDMGNIQITATRETKAWPISINFPLNSKCLSVIIKVFFAKVQIKYHTRKFILILLVIPSIIYLEYWYLPNEIHLHSPPT